MTSRRDFLKLAGALSCASLVSRLPYLDARSPAGIGSPPNVIVLLFDALSAFHLSLHGYPRPTSPNIDRFAERAIVYHNHHSAGNFTTPSTASLFTSTYPWEHRAITLTGLVKPAVVPNNIFRLLGSSTYQAAFAQNIYADMLLYQFDRHLDRHQALDSYALVGNTFYDHLPGEEAVYALKGYDQFIFKREEAHGSLFLSILNDLNFMLRSQVTSRDLSSEYPFGLPRLANTDVYFSMEGMIDGVIEMLDGLHSPAFTYIHLMPPHEPYRPSRHFLGTFDDGWAPPAKKGHPLATRVPEKRLVEKRQAYDEFIADLDAQFGRLLDHLEMHGRLEDSYIVVTSDHGELFERGVHGHSTPLLFEPVIRPPLLVSTPGQRQRQDIHALTSNVDLMPSLLHLAGIPIPERCAGRVLPGLGGEADPQREVWAMEAKKNPTHGPLGKVSLALLHGPYKLVYYLGYAHYDGRYEFYDLENDPQELADLYPDHPMAGEMRARLDDTFNEMKSP